MALKRTHNKRGRDNTALNKLAGSEVIAITSLGKLGVFIVGMTFLAALLGIGEKAGVKTIVITIIIGFMFIITAALIAYIIEKRRKQ
ncbi:MAG: hypothetical protein LBU73_01665 [Helicobacteraceae bacterium]|jgi:uncharacterized membrane protein|nr:hypothetical protein [Helicobacteraceae bacterium]